MDWESIGSGAATGFVVSILTLLGWNRRLGNLETNKLDKDVYVANQIKLEGELKNLRDVDLKIVREDIRYIRERFDKLSNGMRS